MNQEIIYPSMNSLFSCDNVDYGIKRESQIDTIKFYLKSEQVVYINASSCIGKTTILKQIFEEYKYDAITLFIDKSKSKFISDVEIYKDLYIQIRTYMGEYSSDDIKKDVSKADVERIIKTLTYFLKYKKREVYFFLDDLYFFDENDNNFLLELFLIFPTDENYKYLVTRDSSSKNFGITSKKIQNYSLNIFSLDEVRHCLPTVSLEYIEQIRDSFGFSPETISFIKEMVERNVSIEEVFQSTSNDSMKGLYDSEWRRVVKCDFVEEILGVVAYSVDKLSVIELCSILQSMESDVLSFIDDISFLKCEGGYVFFNSNGAVNYCREKLVDKKTQFIDMLLGQINEGLFPKDTAKVAFYLTQKKEYEKVLNVISDEHIGETFNRTRSINEVHKIVNFGIKACEKLEVQDRFVKYKFLKSGLSNIYNSELMLQQLHCHLAADESNNALMLIQKATSEEEMLQLYCIFVMSKNKEGISADEDILNKIDYLYEKIDVSELGPERTIDICADLLPIMPEKALALINKLDSLNVAGQNKSDFAFLNLSLLTFHRHGDSFSTNVNKEDVRELSRSTIIETIKSLNKNATTDNLLEFFKNFTESGDRIFLYRAWLKNNKKNKNSIVILNEILNEIFQSVDFSIDASLFSDITECLNHIDSHECIDVLSKIKPQLITLKNKGPTVDYCTLILNMINHAENKNKKVTFLNDIVKYTLSVNDYAVRLTCLSHICGFEKKYIIHNEIIDVEQEKNKLLDKIVDTDALHIEVLKESISVESQYDLNNAILWSDKFNNVIRRNKAKSIAIYNYLKGIDSVQENRKVNDVVCLIRSISEEEYREDTYYIFIEKYMYFHPSKTNTDKLIKFLSRIQNNYIKARCLILLYCEAYNLNVLRENATLIDYISSAINKTDGDDHKAELFFYACQMTFKINREISSNFKFQAINVVDKNGYSSEGQIEFKMFSIELAIRCLYILSSRNEDVNSDLSNLVESISSINSDIKRTRLFSRLASAYQKSGKESFSKDVIEKFIIPILERNKVTAGKEFLLCLLYSLPVIHHYDSEVFLKWYEQIPKNNDTVVDRIINMTIDYIYNDCLIGDPYDQLKNKYTIGYRELNWICNLIKLVKEDGNQFFEIKRLLDAIKGLRKKNKISKVQEDDLCGSVLQIFGDNFPKQNYISHFGYKLLFEAEIKSISEDLVLKSWEQIVKDSKEICNLSDRSFVLSQISMKLPEKYHDMRKILFQESISLIDILSSNIEKANRYKVVCENHRSYDKSIVKVHLKKAFMLCSNNRNIQSSTRLEIIDMVNSYGDAFSSSLVNMLDDDPARKKIISENIEKRKKCDDLKKKFQNNLDISVDENDDALADLLWQQLAIINSKSGHVPKTFNVHNYINNITLSDIEGVYKVLSYYIHSSYLSNSSRVNVVQKIRPLFDVFISCLKILKMTFEHDSANVKVEVDSNVADYIIISEGEAETALLFIKKWFSQSECKKLVIIEPFLKIDDFEFIANVISMDPEVELVIISSLESKRILDKNGDFDDYFHDYWNENISKTDTPFIDLIFISYGEDNKFPIHDRWWLSGSSVIECGTSINGWGSKTSKLKILPSNEAAEVDSKISPYISMKKKFIEEERLKYKLVKI